MSTTPEGAVKRGVKKTLTSIRGLWHYMPVQNGLGRVGIPDFIACVPYVVRPEDVGKTLGLFYAVETKAPGKLNTLTPNQRREIDGIRAAAGRVDVVDDARNLCLPISDYAEINPTEVAVPEGVQRAAGEREQAREEQRGPAPAHARGPRPCRRRQGCRAPASAGARRDEREEQPGSSIT